MNWFKKKIGLYRERLVARIAYETAKEITYNLFSYMGTERIKKVIQQAEKADHIYLSLADIYGLTLRDNLERENSQRLHAYHDLLPRLDEFRKAFSLTEEELNERYIFEDVGGVGKWVKKRE